MRRLLVAAVVVVLWSAGLASPATAAGNEFVTSGAQPCAAAVARNNPWAVNFSPVSGQSAQPRQEGQADSVRPVIGAVNFSTDETAGQEPQARRRVVAFEYSEGYKLRAKIHKVASIATLPLFIGEYFVGANLYNHPETESGGKRGLHSGLATSMGVLFGVNTVTGVWNLVEARKDPNRRTLRTIHSILMLVADAGFVATAATAPSHEDDEGMAPHVGPHPGSSRHRAVAISSMGVAAVSYLMMLFGGK